MNIIFDWWLYATKLLPGMVYRVLHVVLYKIALELFNTFFFFFMFVI